VPTRVQVAAPAPVTGAPDESTAAALSCRVEPSAPNATDAGVAVTAFTTCATDTVTAGEVAPPDEAVICVLPLPTAVTRPVPLTVATAVLDELHEIEAPGIAAVAASRATAVNCAVRVRVWKLGGVVGAVITTDATVVGGVPPSPPPPPHAVSANNRRLAERTLATTEARRVGDRRIGRSGMGWTSRRV
jgi:hypothetical protein